MNETNTSIKVKKDYRKIQIVISPEEREEIKARAYELLSKEDQTGVQTTLAEMLFTSPQNIFMAFSGQNMKLMARIKQFINTYSPSEEFQRTT